MIDNLDELLAKHPLPFTLHDLQREDIQLSVYDRRIGLFLPVGYGKTVIATMIALAWEEDYRIVLVPPILVKQWVKWIESIPNSGGAWGYNGTPAARKAIPLREKSWWIMSYQIYKNDLAYLLRCLKDDTVTHIVDEAHNLKNPGSKLFQAINTTTSGRSLMLLTGTEMNNPGDAYAYIKLKTPSIYRSKAHFENLHVLTRDYFDRPLMWDGVERINENLYLQSRQRTKEQVHAHLPAARYIPMFYDLAPAHMKMYNDLSEQMVLETEQGGKIDGSTPGKLRNVLQQMVINWAHFAENQDLRPAFLDLLDTVMDEIDVQSHTSSKLIVWSWFKLSTEMITRYLNSIGVPAVAAYSGANSVRSVDMFMEDPNTRVLVAQPGSAGAGLNPQHICWEAIFAEIPTRTIPFRQSAGRIDREGQRFNPNIRIALASNTCQPGMFADLLTNDGEVQRVQGSAYDLRKLVFDPKAEDAVRKALEAGLAG